MTEQIDDGSQDTSADGPEKDAKSAPADREQSGPFDEAEAGPCVRTSTLVRSRSSRAKA